TNRPSRGRRNMMQSVRARVRWLAVPALVVTAEVMAVVVASLIATSPAAAQFGFPFFDNRPRRQAPYQQSPYGWPWQSWPQERREAPVDFSKAPPARKHDTPPTTSIVVLGDSMADWLA